MTKKVYAGKHTQLGQYLNQNNHFVDYNIADPSSWSFLNETECLFYIVPKTADTVDNSKKFFLAAAEAKVKHIVKLGSLGPWRIVHKQLNEFIKECGIVCSNIDHAPLMSNIFTEQYQNQVLYNYRHHTPAPYLDPRALAALIEKLMSFEHPLSQNISVTGGKQYYIEDVKRILEQNSFPVIKIAETHNDQLHKNPSLTPDQQLMTKLGNEYALGKYPKVSTDLASFGLQSRTFEEFVVQDKEIYLRSFSGDKNL